MLATAEVDIQVWRKVADTPNLEVLTLYKIPKTEEVGLSGDIFLHTHSLHDRIRIWPTKSIAFTFRCLNHFATGGLDHRAVQSKCGTVGRRRETSHIHVFPLFMVLRIDLKFVALR